jgi:hypothetical protein
VTLSQVYANIFSKVLRFAGLKSGLYFRICKERQLEWHCNLAQFSFAFQLKETHQATLCWSSSRDGRASCHAVQWCHRRVSSQTQCCQGSHKSRESSKCAPRFAKPTDCNNKHRLRSVRACLAIHSISCPSRNIAAALKHVQSPDRLSQLKLREVTTFQFCFP